MEQLESIERRRRTLRIIFMGIIVLTVPFYCVGFFLWATAPSQGATNRLTPTITPIDQTLRPTTTLLPTSAALATMTAAGGTLRPTPGQYIPPIIVTAAFSSPTPGSVFIPTSTTAPSLTPFPSSTPFIFPTPTTAPLLPTFTPIPIFPTNTPQPPPPTNTDTPPLPTPTTEVLLPPTDTPGP
jgi:hypothetical protein